MTPNDFRRIALGMEGAVEGEHMAHPDFRASNGRIFATIAPDAKWGMVALTPERQVEFMRDSPDKNETKAEAEEKPPVICQVAGHFVVDSPAHRQRVRLWTSSSGG